VRAGIPLPLILWHDLDEPSISGTTGIRAGYSMRRTRPAIGALFFFGMASVLALYFTFAAVQGSFGLFNRVQVQAENAELVVRRDRLETELAALQNKTARLSDDFLEKICLLVRALGRAAARHPRPVDLAQTIGSSMCLPALVFIACGLILSVLLL
jgi:hypothetical protein